MSFKSGNRTWCDDGGRFTSIVWTGKTSGSYPGGGDTPLVKLHNYIFQTKCLLWWDAADPASWPGSGTKLTDLSGFNRHGYVSGGTHNAANGGHITGGTSSYIKVGMGPGATTDPGSGSTLRENDINFNYHEEENSGNQRYSVVAGVGYNGGSRGRTVCAVDNNGGDWFMCHHSSGTRRYHPGAWIHNDGPNDTNWRIYVGTGNVSTTSDMEQYDFYVSNATPGAGIDRLANNSSGGTCGPQGIGIGKYFSGNSEQSDWKFSFMMVYDDIIQPSQVDGIYQHYRGRFGI